MKNIVGIDVGYGITKAYSITRDRKELSTRFPSVYMETEEEYIPDEQGDYIHVILNGKNYIIGQKAASNDGVSAFDKYDMLRHKLCVITAIARMYGNFSGTIAVGLPISDVKKMEGNLKKLKGEYEFVYNGKNCDIVITEVLVYSQGITAFSELEEYENIKDHIIGIIDIGQKTVDVAWYNYGDEVKSKRHSYDNLGCSFIYRDIADEVYQKYDYMIPDYQVAQRIATRDEIKEIAQRHFQKFADKIIENLRRLGWNYAELDRLVIIGGGSYYIENFIKERISCTELHQNATYANACGFFFKAVKQYG